MMMRPNTLRKYQRIQQRYRELYDGKRLRHDDVIQHLMDEFFISELTVYRILRTEIPSPKQSDSHEKDSKSD
ncbi:MAG: hypothetical protein D6751_05465 [Deltaproteobacteria bacterium]|nr:MAG: hypothetical protein D6751_05465 [Deltaproteobacteria bacterium]